MDVYLITASFVGEIQRDFKGYVDMVRRAGYRGLELFNCIYGGMGAKELRAFLDSRNLRVISAHVNVEDTPGQLRFLPEIGCSYIVCPGLRMTTADQAQSSADLLNRLGAQAKAAGMKYAYHNHAGDFLRVGDEMVMEILLRQTDPTLVSFELDTAWAWRAGVDAAQFIREHPGRFELIHVKETTRVLTKEDDLSAVFKDAKRDENGRLVLTGAVREKLEAYHQMNAKLGSGLINMPAVKAAADAQGAVAYIVEREYAYTGDPYTTILADREYLDAL